MITQQDIRTATELAESHPSIKRLIDFYNYVINNSAYESYIIRKNYQDNWNKELEEKKVALINSKGKDSDLHDKAIERAMKFFDGQLEFLKDTEAIRTMLTPQEQVKASSDPRLKKAIVDIPL